MFLYIFFRENDLRRGRKCTGEFKKPKKLRDSALIARTQRDTLKQRRLFIEKKHGGSVEHLIKRFPFLRKKLYF